MKIQEETTSSIQQEDIPFDFSDSIGKPPTPTKDNPSLNFRSKPQMRPQSNTFSEKGRKKMSPAVQKKEDYIQLHVDPDEDVTLSDLGIHEDIEEYDDDLFEQPIEQQRAKLNQNKKVDSPSKLSKRPADKIVRPQSMIVNEDLQSQSHLKTAKKQQPVKFEPQKQTFNKTQQAISSLKQIQQQKHHLKNHQRNVSQLATNKQEKQMNVQTFQSLHDRDSDFLQLTNAQQMRTETALQPAQKGNRSGITLINFNRPNIMNFNHNDFDQKQKASEALLPYNIYPGQEDSNIQTATNAIIQNRRRIVSSLNPQSASHTQFYRQMQPFVRASSTQNLQQHLQQRQDRPNSLIRHLQNNTKEKNRLQKERVNQLIQSHKLRNFSVGCHNIRDPSQKVSKFHDGVSQETLIRQLEVMSLKSYDSNLPVDLEESPKKPGRKIKRKTQKRQKSMQEQYLKNEVFLLKTQLNLFKDDNLCLRTQNASKQEKLKEKQKLIDELVAVTKDQEQQLVFGQNHLESSNNINKFRLVETINDLRLKLNEKSKQLTKLERDLKTTKVKELQLEVQIYQQECIKLRYISHEAVKLLVKHGLSSKLNYNPQLKTFFKSSNFDQTFEMPSFLSQQFGHRQEPLQSVQRVPSVLSQNRDQEVKMLKEQLQQANSKIVELSKAEEQWVKEKNQMNLLLKQANNLQDQFNQKLTEQDVEIERLQSLATPKNNNLLSPKQQRKIELPPAPAFLTVNSKEEELLSQIASITHQNEKLMKEKNDLYQQLQEFQHQVIDKNNQYIALQNQMSELSSKTQPELFELQIKHKKQQEIHETAIQANKLLQINLKKTVQNLNHQLDECQNMNEQLFEEISQLREKLIAKNIKIEDLDRSDTLSRISMAITEKSRQIKKQNLYYKIPHEHHHVKKENGNSPVDVILEQSEDEDADYHMSPLEVGQQEQEIQDLQQELQIKQKQDKKKRINRSHSTTYYDEQKYQKNSEVNLVEAIDRINEKTTIKTSEIDQTSHFKSQMTNLTQLEIKSIIQQEDISIKESLDRVGRMQQIKRINLDSIERELFAQTNYKFNRFIKLQDLANLFITKLGLTQLQANKFARFLCEESDQDGSRHDNKVSYNSNLKVQFPLVIARLQIYSVYPIIYSDSLEQESLSKFKGIFESKQELSEFCELFDDEDKLYTINYFYNYLSSYIQNKSISDRVIDCVYVMLCRRVPFSDINLLSNKQLVQSYQGFKSAAVKCILDSEQSEVSSLQNVRNTQIEEPQAKIEQYLEAQRRISNFSFVSPIEQVQSPNHQSQNSSPSQSLTANADNQTPKMFQKQHTAKVQTKRPSFSNFIINEETERKESEIFNQNKGINIDYSEDRSEVDWDLQESKISTQNEIKANLFYLAQQQVKPSSQVVESPKPKIQQQFVKFVRHQTEKSQNEDEKEDSEPISDTERQMKTQGNIQELKLVMHHTAQTPIIASKFFSDEGNSPEHIWSQKLKQEFPLLQKIGSEHLTMSLQKTSFFHQNSKQSLASSQQQEINSYTFQHKSSKDEEESTPINKLLKFNTNLDCELLQVPSERSSPINILKFEAITIPQPKNKPWNLYVMPRSARKQEPEEKTEVQLVTEPTPPAQRQSDLIQDQSLNMVCQLKERIRHNINKRLDSSTLQNKGIDKLVSQCTEVLVVFSKCFKSKNNPSLFAHFQPTILTNENFSVFLIPLSDFSQSIKDILECEISNEQLQAMNFALQDPMKMGFINYELLKDLFAFFDLVDIYPFYRHISFSQLDFMSIRILSLINTLLQDCNCNLPSLFSESIISQKFMTNKSQPKQVACLQVSSLTQMLFHNKIIHQLSLPPCLLDFLCFNKNLQNLIPLDKLEHILQIVDSDSFLSSFKLPFKFIKETPVTVQSQLEHNSYEEQFINTTSSQIYRDQENSVSQDFDDSVDKSK